MVILYADDDKDDREFFCEAVKQINPLFTLIEAKDGLDAIHIMQRSKAQVPNIIFLDVNMPLLDGFETLVELKKNRRLWNTEFVMYSTAIKSRSVEPYKYSHISYLKKSNTMKDSIDSIRAIIERS